MHNYIRPLTFQIHLEVALTDKVDNNIDALVIRELENLGQYQFAVRDMRRRARNWKRLTSSENLWVLLLGVNVLKQMDGQIIAGKHNTLIDTVVST